MTSKEWVQNELSLSWECLTTTDRFMLNKILQDLERLEKLEKVIEWLKKTFEITLDSKLRISDGVDCVQAFPIDIDKSVVIYDLLKEVLGNE